MILLENGQQHGFQLRASDAVPALPVPIERVNYGVEGLKLIRGRHSGLP